MHSLRQLCINKCIFTKSTNIPIDLKEELDECKKKYIANITKYRIPTPSYICCIQYISCSNNKFYINTYHQHGHQCFGFRCMYDVDEDYNESEIFRSKLKEDLHYYNSGYNDSIHGYIYIVRRNDGYFVVSEDYNIYKISKFVNYNKTIDKLYIEFNKLVYKQDIISMCDIHHPYRINYVYGIDIN